MQSLMLTASQDIDKSIDMEKLIKHCKDYFFHARYSYEKESLQCLNSDVIVLARHMKKLVRKLGEPLIKKLYIHNKSRQARTLRVLDSL